VDLVVSKIFPTIHLVMTRTRAVDHRLVLPEFVKDLTSKNANPLRNAENPEFVSTERVVFGNFFPQVVSAMMEIFAPKPMFVMLPEFVGELRSNVTVLTCVKPVPASATQESVSTVL